MITTTHKYRTVLEATARTVKGLKHECDKAYVKFAFARAARETREPK